MTLYLQYCTHTIYASVVTSLLLRVRSEVWDTQARKKKVRIRETGTGLETGEQDKGKKNETNGLRTGSRMHRQES